MRSRTKRNNLALTTVNPKLKSHAQDPQVKEKLMKAVEVMNHVKRSDS